MSRPARKFDDELLRRLWCSRLPEKQIEKIMDHHRNAIQKRAKKIGLPPRRVIWSQEVQP